MTDVLVVGAGPVGTTLGILLAQQGHEVTVLDKRRDRYPLARAVHFDDEVARIFATAGLGDVLPRISEPADEYDWRNAAGQTLVRMDWSGPGRSGWPTANMFHQPDLEAALETRAEALQTLTIRRGVEVTDVTDRGDHVEVVTTEGTVQAPWVVGCDGAGSLVRDRLGTGVEDLGYFFDWLILDVLPHEPQVWSPMNLQICDPLRPTTCVSGGPGRRRWEFMALPGESIDDLDTEEAAWDFLRPWGIDPGNAVLERHTVYRFQAQWARTWRRGRLLIAGDAAHLMPPFAGQGMCSGVRDAANLAWKLDRVLRKESSDTLLDAYGSERAAHVQHAIQLSVGLGNVICVPDPDAAAARDAAMIAAREAGQDAMPPLPPELLGPGIHCGTAGSGQVVPQGTITADGRTGLLDDVVGSGWRLVARTRRPAPGLDVVALDEVEEDGTLTRFLDAHGWDAVVVRPDAYVFGGSALDDLPALLADLERQLS